MDNQQERIEVILAMTRDTRAFNRLVESYQAKLAYYVRRFVSDNDTANDLLQEVWLLVYRKLPTLRAPEAFRVWLYKIAHDVTISYLRKQSRERWRQADDIEVETTTDDWNEFEAFERAELVHQALPKLSEPHREVLLLRFLEGLDLAEIANIVGCDQGTVKSRLHYAKHALKILIGSIHE